MTTNTTTEIKTTYGTELYKKLINRLYQFVDIRVDKQRVNGHICGIRMSDNHEKYVFSVKQEV
jgi:hypothetical protein